MSNKTGLIIWIPLFILIIWLIRRINLWRFKRTYNSILIYLKENNAISPESAIRIPGSKKDIFSAGIRNFRQEAVRFLLSQNIIDKTDDDKYFLKN